MKKENITQEQLADKLDMKSYSSIGKWLKGTNSPNLNRLVLLSTKLQISLDDLIFKDLTK